MHIQLDLNVKHTKIEPKNIFSKISTKILKNEEIEENFDTINVANLILRALAKAKFKNTRKIIIDKKTVYNHPEIVSDLRKTIDIFDKTLASNAKTIEISATHKDIEKCTVEIKIKKIHKRKEHSIGILLRGEIKEELYHIFCNYLVEKLGLEKESFNK